MTTPDPLARLRDAFKLEQAARIVCDVPLFRRRPQKLSTLPQVERDEWERVDYVLGELRLDAARLEVAITEHPAEWSRRENFVTRETVPYLSKSASTEYGEVTRSALVAWCEAKGLRPSALFEPEVRPDSGSVGVAEMNANRALAAMALLLARSVKKFQRAGKPNVSQIGSAVDEVASELFGDDATGLKQFRKRLAQALKEFPEG
jgi:hypothetical protein